MTTVSFNVDLDRDAITARGLDAWRDVMYRDHDLTVDDWTDVFRAIGMCHLAGGEFSDYVTGTDWDVIDEPHTHTPDCHVTCPYPPKMGTLEAKAQQYPGVTVISDPTIGVDVQPSEAGAGPYTP